MVLLTGIGLLSGQVDNIPLEFLGIEDIPGDYSTCPVFSSVEILLL